MSPQIDWTMHKWYAVEDDCIGGWSIATVDKPCSQLDSSNQELMLANFVYEYLAKHMCEIHNAWLKNKMQIQEPRREIYQEVAVASPTVTELEIRTELTKRLENRIRKDNVQQIAAISFFSRHMEGSGHYECVASVEVEYKL